MSVLHSGNRLLLGWSIRDKYQPEIFIGLPDPWWPYHTSEWSPWSGMTQSSTGIRKDLSEYDPETKILFEIEIDDIDRFGEDFKDLMRSNPYFYDAPDQEADFQMRFPKIQSLNESNRTLLGFDVVNCELERRRPNVDSLAFQPQYGMAEYGLLKAKEDAVEFGSWLCSNYLDCEEIPIHILTWYTYSPQAIALLLETKTFMPPPFQGGGWCEAGRYAESPPTHADQKSHEP